MSQIDTSTTESQTTANPEDNSAAASNETEVTNSASPQVEGDETADDSETSENADESQDENADDDAREVEVAKKKGGVEKRINKLTAKLSKEAQEKEFWKAQALKSQTAAKQDSQSQPNASSAGLKEPNPDDFETVGAYYKAVAKYETALAREEDRRESEKAKASDYSQRIQRDYTAKFMEFSEKTPDIEEVIADFEAAHGGFRASPNIAEAIQTSEFGPQIQYEIMKTPGEFARLEKMSEAAIIREIGKKEARLAAAAEAAKKIKTSKAPAPVSTVGKGSASTTKSLNDPNISFAEYEKIRMQQLKNKGI